MISARTIASSSPDQTCNSSFCKKTTTRDVALFIATYRVRTVSLHGAPGLWYRGQRLVRYPRLATSSCTCYLRLLQAPPLTARITSFEKCIARSKVVPLEYQPLEFEQRCQWDYGRRIDKSAQIGLGHLYADGRVMAHEEYHVTTKVSVSLSETSSAAYVDVWKDDVGRELRF